MLTTYLCRDLWFKRELRTSSTEAWAVYLKAVVIIISTQKAEWTALGHARVDGREVCNNLTAVLTLPNEARVDRSVELRPTELLGEEEVEPCQSAELRELGRVAKRIR